MPLIIICGYPSTGKTSFANYLVDVLKSRGIEKIALVNEELIGVSKKSGYKNSHEEKLTRAALKSAADHQLSVDNYVIIDSLNYIKGYRYELYCSARTFRTPHCAVWVDCPRETATMWNTQREDSYVEDV